MSASLVEGTLGNRGNTVFRIRVSNLSPGLLAYPDGGDHVTIAPAVTIPYTTYSSLLYSTRLHWQVHN